jgi:hypothetical protein
MAQGGTVMNQAHRRGTPLNIVRTFLDWFWEDLGVEEPSPGRVLLGLAVAIIMSLALWATIILVLAEAKK